MTAVGSSVVVGKAVVAHVPVFVLNALRFALASAILMLLAALLERPLPRLTRHDVAVLALQGFTGIFAFNTLLLYGLTLTTAAEAGIVTSMTPAVAAALAVLVLGEAWSWPRTAGIVLAVAGVLLLNLQSAGGGGGAAPLLGNALVLGAVIGEAVFVVCSRVAARRLPPVVVAAAISVLGFLMFLPGALIQAGSAGLRMLSWSDWLAVGYYGIVVTVLAFLLWARGVARVPAGTAAAFTGLIPVSALALSALALGEAVTGGHLVAAALVVAGIVALARAS